MNSLSEKEQLAAVSKNGYVIQCIVKPSEDVQLAAVSKDGEAIQFIDKPSLEVIRAALQQNKACLIHIRNFEKIVLGDL